VILPPLVFPVCNHKWDELPLTCMTLKKQSYNLKVSKNLQKIKKNGQSGKGGVLPKWTWNYKLMTVIGMVFTKLCWYFCEKFVGGNSVYQPNVLTAKGQCCKTNTTVIYCHFRFNYHSIFITLNLPWNGSRSLQYFTPRKSRVKITMVNYRSIFITLAPSHSFCYLDMVPFTNHNTFIFVHDEHAKYAAGWKGRQLME